MPPLTASEITRAAIILAESLEACGIEFGIIGGAGVALHAYSNDLGTRQTADIDAIIKPDPEKQLSADSTSRTLVEKFPDRFAAVSQYGVQIPAIRLVRGGTGAQELLVEVELFDIDAWPHRPQYDLRNPANRRVLLQINGRGIHVMSAEWLLREKIFTQAQRAGSKKEVTDILDIENLIQMVDGAEPVDCQTDEFADALRQLLQKRPDFAEPLREVVKFPAACADNVCK